MRNFGFILFFVIPFYLWAAIPPPVVPERMAFCGIELEITDDARKEIQKTVYSLTANEAYFRSLVQKTDTYLPFVEQAFKELGVPDDLKYIVIQESALRGDAVSSSNAVGFWQFKDFTAKEVGLAVNDLIDERKHIYRASVGAGRYFYINNRKFDNYIYSIIAYNQGAGGAMPYTDPSCYGNKKMKITAKLHWYALKAIAHKIAFESFVGKNKHPKIWLEPRSNRGGKPQ